MQVVNWHAKARSRPKNQSIVLDNFYDQFTNKIKIKLWAYLIKQFKLQVVLNHDLANLK